MRCTSFLVLALIACGPHARDEQPSAQPDAAIASVDAESNACPPPPNPAGPDVAFAAPFDQLYDVYDLGPVPGVPGPLGGTVISIADNNTLLVAGASEREDGAIYSIGVKRDPCGHIIGFNGTATLVANTPYVDANLVYMSNNLLLYTEWPQYTLSQIQTNATTPARRTDLRTLGMPTIDSSPGGLGRVPPNLAPAGELRLVTWPSGGWYHAAATTSGSLVDITGLTQTATLPNQPGGFAYVPAGSPGFPKQSVIVAEWQASDADRVSVYETDAQGDPVVSTRKEFFMKFPRPWGAYFEPVTGDYMFLSWGASVDRLYIVQGFVPPVLL